MLLDFIFCQRFMYIICTYVHNWKLLIGCLQVVHPLSKRLQPPISNSLNNSVSGALHLVKFLSCTLTDFKEWLLAQNNIVYSWHAHSGVRWLFIRKKLGLGLFYNPCIIKLIRLDWYISDKDEKKIVICLELTCSMEKSS